MKQINPEQEKAILELARKYNVGVNEFIGLQNMLEKLPNVEEKTDDKSKEPTPEQK